jgi:hypothetical protein
MINCPVVNFINILQTTFCKFLFDKKSWSYRFFNKYIGLKMLMKLTPGNVLRHFPSSAAMEVDLSIVMAKKEGDKSKEGVKHHIKH